METNSITLMHWNVRGLAEPIKMMLEYLHIPYVDKELEFKGPESLEDWNKMKDSLDFECPALPNFRDTQHKISLTNAIAICRYLAQKYKPKMVGSAMNEYAEIDALLYLSYDLRSSIISSYEDGWEKNKEGTVAWIKEKVRYVEKFLKSRSWLSGKLPSIADFVFCEVLEYVNYIDAAIMEPYMRCRNLQKRLYLIPEVAKYRTTQKGFETDKNSQLALLYEH